MSMMMMVMIHHDESIGKCQERCEHTGAISHLDSCVERMY